MLFPKLHSESLLKLTKTRCPICALELSGEVIKIDEKGVEKVQMRRTCPEHGEQVTLLSSDSRFYYLAKGNPDNSGSCGCGSSCSSVGGGRNATLGLNATDSNRLREFQSLSTCVALIEIVKSCNLACPTSFADSPVGVSGDRLDYYFFDDIIRRIEGVLEKKGHIEILQLSGGEPTIHPEFTRIVRWVRKNSKIDYLVINTNGLLFASDSGFMHSIGTLQGEFDNIQLYLQFDGPQEAGQRDLRGGDLREMKKRAIENCAQWGIPITLAMTVNRMNLPHLWDTVEFARKYDHIRGVSFQPMFMSGRVPQILPGIRLPDAINVADIVLGLNSQSGGLIDCDDFTALPCGDPNCACIGWLFRMGGTYYSPKQHGVDVSKLQAGLPNRINYSIEDLKRCGCDNTALGDLMRSLELRESNAFRLFIKPFMDSRTWDQHRIDRCCTHVIRPDGQLDSFCRYYAK